MGKQKSIFNALCCKLRTLCIKSGSNKKEPRSLFDELNDNTMFHLSLGSKELFHSNFLEFLWNQDKVRFISMLGYLLGGENAKLKDIKETLQNETEEESYYILAREKENFDICIYHKENGRIHNGEYPIKHVYDVIIENKVKSIPYKEQLERYEKKVEDNQGIKPRKENRYLPENKKPIYILLSLATEFPEKGEIRKQNNWHMASYQQLHDAIKEIYGEGNTYIKDYLSFIENLHSLKDEIIKDNFEVLPYYNPEEMEPFAVIRLHDMYVKLRGSYFVCLLKEALKYISKTYNAYIEFYPGKTELPKIEKEKFDKYNVIIWLASEMTNAKQSTITAKIKMRGSENMYEVQVEGDNYRHMFNHPKLVEKRDKDKEWAKKVERCLGEMDYFKIDKLPLFNNQQKYEQWDGNTDKGYNQYKPDILYKYVKIPQDIKVKAMIEILVEDIENVLGYIDKCESHAKELKTLTL